MTKPFESLNSAPQELVLGAPGTGKTTWALQELAQALGSGKSATLLVPSRSRAAQLLEHPLLQQVDGVNPVRTLSSLAFEILRIWHVERSSPEEPPVLLTGGAEDALLEQVIAAGNFDWEGIIDSQSLSLPAFRSQLRNLFARAEELDLSGADLISLGREKDMKVWQVAGVCYQEMLQRQQQMSPKALTSAQLLRRAARCLQGWCDSGVLSQPAKFDLLLVDDGQDFTWAGGALLKELAKFSQKTVVFANPDAATQGYRGGQPFALVDWAESEKWPVTHLSQVFTQGPNMLEVTGRIRELITVHGPAAQRECHSVQTSSGEGALPGVFLHEGDSQQLRWIIRQLRQGQIQRGWDATQQAVIVRTASQVAAVRAGLERSGLAVAPASRPIVLGKHPVVGAFLAAGISQGEDFSSEASLAVAQNLLFSPLFGVDLMQLRHLVRLADPLIGVNPNLILRYALENTSQLQSLASEDPVLSQVVEHLEGLKEFFATAKQVQDQPAQMGLWQLWQCLGVAEKWRAEALGAPSAVSRSANQNLDAFLTLFRNADIWQQRYQGTWSQFATELLSQKVESDSLASGGQVLSGVEVLTPEGAVGRFFKQVIVASVQKNVWPNLKLRDSFTATDYLQEVVCGQPNTDLRRNVLDDELRMFFLACTRATDSLSISACRNNDQQESFLLSTMVYFGAKAQLDKDGALVKTPAVSDFSLRSLVAQLRRELLSATEDQTVEQVQRILAELVRAGVTLADPQNWHGAYPLSSEVAPQAGSRPYLSPSTIDSILDCPLRWFLTRCGGQQVFTAAIAKGNLIHQLAEEFPRGGADMEKRLQELLEQLDLPETYWGDKEREQISLAASRLEQYLADNPASKILVEESFTQQFPDFALTARLDRLEFRQSAGEEEVSIVDFKTGRNPITSGQAAENGQLAAYQLLLDKLGMKVADACLVYVALDQNKYRAVHAPKWDEERKAQVLNLIGQAAQFSSANEFPAFVTDARSCGRCPVRRSCPAFDRKEQVIR